MSVSAFVVSYDGLRRSTVLRAAHILLLVNVVCQCIIIGGQTLVATQSYCIAALEIMTRSPKGNTHADTQTETHIGDIRIHTRLCDGCLVPLDLNSKFLLFTNSATNYMAFPRAERPAFEA